MTAIQVKGKQLMFESPAPVRTGEAVHVRAHDGERIVDLDVSVTHARELEPGRFLVVGRSEKAEAVASVGDVWGERCDERIAEKFRVLSRDLPGYQALAEDCSLGGLQLVAAGPLQPGERLPLELGLRPTGDDVPCEAEVRWCRDSGQGQFRIGLRFLNPHPVLRSALKALLCDRLGREPVQIEPPAVSEELPAQVEGEEQALMRGVVFRLKRVARSLHMWVLLDNGEQREIIFPNVLDVRDFRRTAGTQIGYLTCRVHPSHSEVRFLTPSMDRVLEFETAPPVAA